jgi:hypothetical protein
MLVCGMVPYSIHSIQLVENGSDKNGNDKLGKQILTSFNQT